MGTIVAEAMSADGRERHRIIDDGKGMGGFMSPPGHVNHRYWHEVTDRPSGRGPWRAEPDSMGPLNEEIPGAGLSVVRTAVRRLFAEQELVCSEAWMSYVYGYFRVCYFPAGIVDVNGGIAKTGTPEQHGGYLTVRKYFPGHEPRVDLIESGGSYGTWECRGCERRVQYEPRIDGFAVYGEQTAACIDGEPHKREA